MKPKSQTHPVQKPPDCNFRSGMFGANRLHNATALGGRASVGHGIDRCDLAPQDFKKAMSIAVARCGNVPAALSRQGYFANSRCP
jgi:hypothetical protein